MFTGRPSGGQIPDTPACESARVTQIWAHRGARLIAPENTMAAYAAAIDSGADGIELDVHLTADGQVVCAHDAVLTGADGARVVLGDGTRDEVARLDVGTLAHGTHRVPLLGEVLDLVSATDTVLNIELKHGDAPYRGLERAVLDLVDAAGLADRVVHSSFNHLSLMELRTLAPGAQIAPLYVEALVEPWEYARRLGVAAMHPHAATLALPGVLEGFAHAGIAVRPWTVNDPATLATLYAAGVDAVITDDPAAAVAVRDSALGTAA